MFNISYEDIDIFLMINLSMYSIKKKRKIYWYMFHMEMPFPTIIKELPAKKMCSRDLKGAIPNPMQLQNSLLS